MCIYTQSTTQAAASCLQMLLTFHPLLHCTRRHTFTESDKINFVISPFRINSFRNINYARRIYRLSWEIYLKTGILVDEKNNNFLLIR